MRPVFTVITVRRRVTRLSYFQWTNADSHTEQTLRARIPVKMADSGTIEGGTAAIAAAAVDVKPETKAMRSATIQKAKEAEHASRVAAAEAKAAEAVAAPPLSAKERRAARRAEKARLAAMTEAEQLAEAIAQADAERAAAEKAKAEEEAKAKPAKTKSEMLEQLDRDARRHRVKQGQHAARMGRLGNLSKSARQMYLSRVQAAKKRDKARYDAEDAKEESEKLEGQSFEDMEKRHQLKKEDLVSYAMEFVTWTWRAFRPYLVKRADIAKKTFAYRARFMMVNDPWVKQGFVDVFILMIHGHVFGTGTDNLDGLEGLLKDSGGRVSVSSDMCLESLPGASEKLLKDGIITHIDNIKIDAVPTMELPWWNLKVIHRKLVIENVLTEADFEREFPESEARMTLMREALEEQENIKANLETWREEQSEAEAERAKRAETLREKGIVKAVEEEVGESVE